MASLPHHCCADYLTEDEQADTQEPSASAKSTQLREREYDFVEKPSQDHMCPVTLELLRDPQQTTCCGQHLSLEAATRLQRERKPCPMCSEPNLTTMPDKFYKRKVNELKVRCPYKGSGCEWVGEVGNMDQHFASCLKRPSQCNFCDFKSTYEVVTNNHIPVCVKYPEPCPNHCEIGAIPRFKVKEHLSKCPLQLVECKFAKFGCQERVVRQDLTRHMEEEAQHHLQCMSFFDLSLTRELHQQMAEKDQQMAEKDLQIAKLQEQNKELQKQLQQHGKQLEKQLSELDRKMVAYERKIGMLQVELESRDKQMKAQLEQHMKPLQEKVSKPEVSHDQLLFHKDMVITDYTTKKRKPNMTPYGESHYYECHSDPFYCHKYKFKLNIDILQNGDIRGYLYLLTGQYDNSLQWPIQYTAQLFLLNQLGGHGHRLAVVSKQLGKRQRGNGIPIKNPFVSGADLGLDDSKCTLYLKDDSLHFRLYLNVYI